MHADYDLLMAPSPTDDLSGLFCLGANEPRGVAAFHFPCFTDRAWTKAEAAAALNATDAQLDSAQQLAVKVPSTLCEDSAHAPAWCLPSPERRLSGLEARRGRMRPPQPAPQLTTSLAAHQQAQLYAGLLVLRRAAGAQCPLPCLRTP